MLLREPRWRDSLCSGLGLAKASAPHRGLKQVGNHPIARSPLCTQDKKNGGSGVRGFAGLVNAALRSTTVFWRLSPFQSLAGQVDSTVSTAFLTRRGPNKG
jgi:hypothetical protein